MKLFEKDNIIKIAVIFMISAFFGQISAQKRTDSLHVAHYEINLNITDFDANTISGHANLKVFAKTDGLDYIHLNLKSLTVDSIIADEAAAQFSRENDELYVSVPAMQSGDSVLIKVYYHGSPSHDDLLGGFYFTGGYAYSVGVALHDIPHNYGRCWYPCLEEFTDKSTYTFNITTNENHTAICNGILTDSSVLEGGFRRWTWQMTDPIPTYLTNVAVGEYLCYSDTVQGLERVIPITIYTKPSIFQNIAASFVNLKDIFHLFENKFGAYRWQRIGYVCTPMVGGAMEHATNIAYPNMFVDGSLTYQSVYAHELFHHWFGDLITCERPEEMWINEGFASFCEPLVEALINPAPDTYINNILDVHTSVLQNIVSVDGGHYALDAVPQEVTYGMHSYQKGSLVIHTLKSYMGDSLFYSSLKQLLNQYAFRNINSEEFFEVLSDISGMNLMHFYNDWIHQPGFLDFDVSSFTPHGCGIFGVKIRQNGLATEHLGTDVPVDITFVSSDRDFHTVENLKVTGETTDITAFVPFSPVFAVANYHDKLSDATIDDRKLITKSGNVSFGSTNCRINVTNTPDTTFFMVENHFVSPEIPDPLPEGIYQFSSTHYWNVRFAGGSPEGKLVFKLLRGSILQPDYDLFQNGYDFENLKLMYRENSDDLWHPIPFSRSGTPYNVTITADNILSGQYSFAMGDVDVSVADRNMGNVSIYPNPSKDRISVRTNIRECDKFEIFDSTGRRVKSHKISSGTISVDVSDLESGSYIIVLYSKNVSVARTVFVKK